MEDFKKGSVIAEGKTKAVYELTECSLDSWNNCVVIESKDKITAFDGRRAHELEGKAAISNATNAKVFEFLNFCDFKTAFIRKNCPRSFVARRCEMIPIEWVTRRLATGSFLKRNAGVKEGFKFTPVKLETFLKDDANNDPQWSEEQVLEAEFRIGSLTIRKHEYSIMAGTAISVFEVLERAWASMDCALVDMKIEFGVDCDSGEILIADVIDSDSWRLWPSGDKRLMKDKQVYRNLETVSSVALTEVKRNFQWVANKLDSFMHTSKALVVVIMGSKKDQAHCQTIREQCQRFGLKVEMRISSAHKTTTDTLDIIADYEGLLTPVVFIAVAGRSNGLGPVLAGNSSLPIINCPPISLQGSSKDIWSSLNTPSGLGCCTVLYPEAAAQLAASILGLNDHVIWAKIRGKQLQNWRSIKEADNGFEK